MSSRRLEDCCTALQATLAEFELQLRGAGIDFVRACTYRSTQEQDELYAQGRTKPGLIVTWAKGGQSPHNRTEPGGVIPATGEEVRDPASAAADYYPLMHGKLASINTDAEKNLWERMGKIGMACGLEWGGNWTSRKKDYPHFQLPGWRA